MNHMFKAVERHVTGHKHQNYYGYVQPATNTNCCCKTVCLTLSVTVRKLLDPQMTKVLCYSRILEYGSYKVGDLHTSKFVAFGVQYEELCSC